jgi:hypothetical protein
LTPFLDALARAAQEAEQAEAAFRREIASRTKALEQERTFAYRRLNVMRAVAVAVGEAECEETAVMTAQATLREKLGWSSDSEARTEVITRFASVASAAFAGLAPSESETGKADVGHALTDFEAWYASTHPLPFWTLFETYMPETPRVDF